MRSDEMTEVFGYRSAREMMTWEAAPTAYLVSSIICAFGVRRAIEEAGLKLGRDISVITFDDDLSLSEKLAKTFRYSLQPGLRCATPAVMTEALLLRLIENPGSSPLNVLLEAELMVGTSTGPAP